MTERTNGSGADSIPAVGVGPLAEPWPDDPRLDPELLAGGDRRNVLDQYRYWTVEAIVADLDRRRHRFHVAIENWEHDRNIGTVVRTANAFLAAEVHIVGEAKVEPPGRNDDRRLPARSPPRSGRRPRRLGHRRGRADRRDRQRFGSVAIESARATRRAFCSSDRRAQACLQPPERRPPWCAQSLNTDRPAASMQASPLALRCTHGFAAGRSDQQRRTVKGSPVVTTRPWR